MSAYALNESDRRILQDVIRRRSGGSQRPHVSAKRPRFSGTKLQGQIEGKSTGNFGPNDAITIDEIALLWGKMPPDVEEGATGSPGEFTVRNIFEQSIVADQIIVAFETKEATPIETESPGLSTQTDAELAASDDLDLAAEEDVGTTTGGEVEWWGFSPGTSTGVAMRTTSAVGTASQNGSQLTLGTGTAVLYSPTGPGSPVFDWTGSPQFDVYNMALLEGVANDVNIQCKIINGLFVVDWEECPP